MKYLDEDVLYPSIIEHEEFDDDLKERPIGAGSVLMANLKKGWEKLVVVFQNFQQIANYLIKEIKKHPKKRGKPKKNKTIVVCYNFR